MKILKLILKHILMLLYFYLQNDSRVAKLKFLEHHPIQSIIANNSKVRFDPRNIYFRRVAIGK
jgi:hypothetical protein